MAYQNISFPAPRLLHGMISEVIAPVTVVSNFAKEYRINRFSTVKQRFRLPGQNMTYADWNILRAFFAAVKWETDSFNYTNPLTGATVKVRLQGIPSVQVVALTASNIPSIVSVGEISLIQVFNE